MVLASALAPTTIVAMIAVTTAPVTTATVIGMIGDIAGTDPGHLLVVPNMTTVVRPGLRPPGGRLMIKGLQGTMITGEEAMMTADPLIIIMTDAGTNQNDAETTGDATRKMSATTIGRGTQTVMADGRVEWILVRYRARD